MSNLETGLAAIKEVTRIVELHTQGKSINQIVGIVLAEQMQKIITDLVGTMSPAATTPEASPGWSICVGGRRPIALEDADRVEVRGFIGGHSAVHTAVGCVWDHVAEWRIAPDNSIRAHEANGYSTHISGDSMPIALAHTTRVDVTFDNGRQVYGVQADDVDWKYAKYYRICAPSA